MPTLLRRKLRCHYCNTYSRNEHAGIPRSWLCPYCDAVNHLDARGNITDPPAEETSSAPAHPVRFVRSRSPTPDMSAPAESPFCDSCQRNQRRLYAALAAYIPDEDDPDYEKYDNAVEEYRAELEERWPQVCGNCIDRVQERIRAAGYAAKADNLRRVLEQSQKYQTDASTPRQFWTNVIVILAEWAYLVSVGVGLLWHAFGAIISTGGGEHVDWRTCVAQTIQVRRVGWDCVLSPLVLGVVKYALVADLLTLWWNPKLAQKTNRVGGRMRGLRTTWTVRATVLFFRFLGLRALDTVDRGSDNAGESGTSAEAVQNYRTTHMVLFCILFMGTLYAWNSVRIVYQSTKSLMQPLDAHLPSVGTTDRKRASQKKPLPNNTSFDTMAQAFTSSFTNEPEPSPALPPSPALTSTSSFSQDSDITTPRKGQTTTPAADDSMDWTPTQRRFAAHQPSIVRSPWAQPPSPTSRFVPPREPVSIFSKPDPNPFRHRVPTAPKAPAAAKANPWKPGIWAPPLKETTPNFFQDAKKMRLGGKDTGLEGVGVPKKVQRDAELFAPPKLKYDNYGEMKETGLEDTFNGLFSK